MEALIYVIVVIALFSLFLAVLPIVLPILFILVVAVAGYILYLRYKVRKSLEDFTKGEDEMNESFSQTFSRTTRTQKQDNVIDVEYTQHDAEDM